MSRQSLTLLGALCLMATAFIPEAYAQTEQAAMKTLPDALILEAETLTLPAGEYTTPTATVRVTQTTTFAVAAGDLVGVSNEPVKLSAQKPQGWGQGTRLPSLRVPAINAYGAFKPGSLAITREPDGEPLAEGKDFLVSPEFGMVGLGPEAGLTPEDTVFASYQFGLRRIDAVHVRADGTPLLVRGEAHIATPLPPEPAQGHTALLNIYRPSLAAALEHAHLFPILEAPSETVARSTPGRIPKTLAKLRAGEAVRIVCWGDSVTAGGDASSPAMAYVEQFRRMLLKTAPTPDAVHLVNVSYGGSNSSQWLRLPPYDDAFFEKTPRWPADLINFQRVLDEKPDLLTIEFVNDAYLDSAGVERVYGEILRRLEALGTEVILITPHFVVPYMMKAASPHTPETRPYVNALYEFAKAHGLAVADASARWAHLAKEGIPYTTLLVNTVNHPDDRGHRFFAEALMACFE